MKIRQEVSLTDIILVVGIIVVMFMVILGSISTLMDYEFGSPNPEPVPQIEASSWTEEGAPSRIMYSTIEVDGSKFVVFTKSGYREGIAVVPLCTPVEKE